MPSLTACTLVPLFHIVPSAEIMTRNSPKAVFRMLSPSKRTTFHVRRAVKGDRGSLGWVIERLSPFVESQARLRLGGRGSSSDVEDLVADVWVVALQKIGDLQPREGRYSAVLVRYLGTTTLHLCNNYLRGLARSSSAGETFGAQSSLNGLASETHGIVTRLARRELADSIRACLKRLPDLGREVLVLRLMEHMSNADIARHLGIPANTVAARYRRALEQLRSMLPRDTFEDVWGVRPASTSGD